MERLQYQNKMVTVLQTDYLVKEKLATLPSFFTKPTGWLQHLGTTTLHFPSREPGSEEALNAEVTGVATGITWFRDKERRGPVSISAQALDTTDTAVRGRQAWRTHPHSHQTHV